ncbi:MAG: hypothetical protein WBW78_06180, partial [Terrimicrobiaceae bacterium]
GCVLSAAKSAGHHRQSSGVSRTDGLPSATDAPLPPRELAKSAMYGYGARSNVLAAGTQQT